MQVHIHKARVIDKQSGYHDQLVDITIDSGIIASIKPTNKTGLKKPSSLTVNDIESWTSAHNEAICISVGWVDVFADYREPGYEHKETLASGMAAAAAGGYTDVLIVPNTMPAVNSKTAVQYIQQMAAGNIVNLHALGCATRNAEGTELAEMMDMHSHGAIAFTDGWKPVQNANLMLKAMEYARAMDTVILQLPVDEALSAGGLMNEGPVSTAMGMAGIPVLAETLMVHRDIELLRYTGSRLHITGISTAESVNMIRKAKKDGLNVTCSVTPYHLALTDEVLKGYDSAYKVSPPLRNKADRKAIVNALADGTIDCIASHHRPHEWDAKTKEFEYAAEGMNVQELAYCIVNDATNKDIATTRLVEALTAPRQIFGLTACSINKGNNACLTLFTDIGVSNLTENEKKSAGMNNPFLNKALKGAIIGIINNNQIHIN